MVELARVLQSGAVETAPPPRPVAAAPHLPTPTQGENSNIKIARGRPGTIGELASEIRAAPPSRALLNHHRKRSAPVDESTQQELDEVTLTAAKSARDRRSWMLDIATADIGGALHCANGRHANGNADAGGRLPVAGEPREQDHNGAALKLNGRLGAPSETAADYRAAAFALLNANVNATLEFTRLVATAQPPAEFVALSTSYARKHFELIMAHMAALAAVPQVLTRI